MFIEEVTKIKKINKSTLRYYENRGIIPKVPRDISGHRVYTEENLEWIDFITSLKETGMPLAKIKEYTNLYKGGKETLQARKEIMLQHQISVQNNISETIKHLEKINYKIALYDVQLNNIKRMP
ncbi:MerR family transcriptional regulator [Lactococcus lactis]|uniref:MerR family transcriptional regulator n=1 Tax=Lactococcus lactis TaxID=1358 RepID=UPI00223AC3FF|nr:MerR family transcriptional regulator [Lactococcus lactis]MCT1172472.1 MerR family transcriptional regulator [Lactococcus lactis]MCT1227886.1 MerR family transcriptional regulator [Lactococcus lactis]